MAEHRIFKARFSDIYPLYVQKALRKGRTQDEVDAVILWLTGYTPGGLARQLAANGYGVLFRAGAAVQPSRRRDQRRGVRRAGGGH